MKKILITSAHIPSPVTKFGVFKRLGTFLRAFDESYTLDFLFFVPSTTSFSNEDLAGWIKEVWMVEANAIFQCPIHLMGENKSIWKDYLLPIFNPMLQPRYKKNSGFEQINFIDEYCSKHQPDLIFAHRLGSMCPLLLYKKKLPHIIFDLDDIEHKVLFRIIKSPPEWLSKRLLYLQIPSLMLLERKAIKLAAMTFVCSDQDVSYLTRFYGIKKIFTIPNCIDIPTTVNIPGNEIAVLFLGTYGYKPNVDAAEYLITKVWPYVKNKLPSAKLYIAGGNAQNIPSFSEISGNIIFTGFVEDLSNLYAKVRVVCCPIFAGGGTRIKIIEAAAFGKAIVSSDLGAEGLNLENGKEIILKNEANEIAAACIELLENYEYSSALGKGAREKVTQEFDIENIISLIQKYVERL